MAQHVAGEIDRVARDDVPAAANEGESARGMDQVDRTAWARPERDVRLDSGQPDPLRLAGRRGEGDGVVDDRPVDVHVRRHRLESCQAVGCQDRGDDRRRMQRALDDECFLFAARISDDDLHHEPVDLGLRERIGSLRLDRVLGGHHEERPGNWMTLGADRDLALLHHLEQCRLDLGRGPVDLVREQEVAEHRSELGIERAAVGAVDTRPDEIARDKIRGELDPPERGVEDVGKGLDRQGLRETRDAFEEEVAAREQGDEHPLEHRVLADDDPPDLVEDGLGGPARVDGVGRLRGLASRRLVAEWIVQRVSPRPWARATGCWSGGDLPRLERTVGPKARGAG